MLKINVIVIFIVFIIISITIYFIIKQTRDAFQNIHNANIINNTNTIETFVEGQLYNIIKLANTNIPIVKIITIDNDKSIVYLAKSNNLTYIFVCVYILIIKRSTGIIVVYLTNLILIIGIMYLQIIIQLYHLR